MEQETVPFSENIHIVHYDEFSENIHIVHYDEFSENIHIVHYDEFSENIHIVHYDEQHPREGRCQKYRLTLLNAKTQRAIADELFEDKSPETTKGFLQKNLDASESVFIVTDFEKRYPDILKEIFGRS